MTKTKVNEDFYINKDIKSLEGIQKIYDDYFEDYKKNGLGLSMMSYKKINSITLNYLKILETKAKLIILEKKLSSRVS